MDKRAAARVRWLVASRGVLQAFDDGSFATAIVTNYDGDRGEELYSLDVLVVEGADAANRELVEARHGGRVEGVWPRTDAPRQLTRRRRRVTFRRLRRLALVSYSAYLAFPQ